MAAAFHEAVLDILLPAEAAPPSGRTALPSGSAAGIDLARQSEAAGPGAGADCRGGGRRGSLHGGYAGGSPRRRRRGRGPFSRNLSPAHRPHPSPTTARHPMCWPRSAGRPNHPSPMANPWRRWTARRRTRWRRSAAAPSSGAARPALFLRREEQQAAGLDALARRWAGAGRWDRRRPYGRQSARGHRSPNRSISGTALPRAASGENRTSDGRG